MLTSYRIEREDIKKNTLPSTIHIIIDLVYSCKCKYDMIVKAKGMFRIKTNHGSTQTAVDTGN